jgi:hypothetical protein
MTTPNEQTPAAAPPAPASTPTPAAQTPAAAPAAQTPEALAAAELAKKTPATSALSGTDLGTDEKKNEPAAPGGTDLGSDDTQELNADGTPKAKEAPAQNEFHGFPESGEFELTVPDGFVADDTLKGEFAPIAKELDLSGKGIQKLVDLKAKMDQQAVSRWGDHLVSLKAEAQKDPEIGGAKYSEAVQLAKQTIGKFGTPAFRKMLNDYGVGAHPEMIRYMSNVARATGETPVLDGGAGPGVVQKPLHDILYGKKE